MRREALAILRALWPAARHFFRDGCLDHAAAVAFFALMSLAPSLYLGGLLLRSVLPEEDPAGALVSRLAAFFPGEVTPVLLRIGRSLPARESMVVIALPALVWIATTAFTSLESCINVAFASTAKRRFWRSRLKAFAGATGVSALLVVSLLANYAVRWLEHYRARLGLPPVLGPGAAWAGYGVLLGVSFAAFTILLKILPRGRVRWSSAGSAGLLSLVLWEATRRLFGGMLAHSPAFGLMTGMLAGLVAFLVWIYAAVAICLYGAEVAAILNGNRSEGGLWPGSP